MSLRFKNKIKSFSIEDKSLNKNDYNLLGIQNINNRILSPYTYIKYYNKVVENTEALEINADSYNLTNFQFYPLNKIEIPVYLEKDHIKRQQFKKKILEQKVLNSQEKQTLQEELQIQKRTEELLTQIAQNNKKQEKLLYRTHSIIPKIIKNADQIDFIDQTQKKYFSITKQYMEEINKHKQASNINSLHSKTHRQKEFNINQDIQGYSLSERRHSTENQGFSNYLNEMNQTQKDKQPSKKQFPQIQKIILANKLVKQSSFEANLLNKTPKGGTKISIEDPNSQQGSHHLIGKQKSISGFNSLAGTSQLIVKQQMRGNVSPALSEVLKNQKLQDIQSQKEVIKIKYKKKMDHIQKNKNPQYYMSKNILDKKNITLRKILSSIPQKKLAQIYLKKRENFLETLSKTQKTIDSFNKPLKKFIKPTFNHLILRPNVLVSKKDSQILLTDREKFMTPQHNFRQHWKDNVLENYQLKPYYPRGQDQTNSQNSLLSNKKSMENDSTQSYKIFPSQGRKLDTFDNEKESNQSKNYKFLKLDLKQIQSSPNSPQMQSVRDTQRSDNLLLNKNVNQQSFFSQRNTNQRNSFRHSFTLSNFQFDTTREKFNLKHKKSIKQEPIQIIDEAEKKKPRNKLKQSKTQGNITKPNLLDHYQKVLRIKNPGEVLTTILKKGLRKKSTASNSTQEFGNQTTFYTSNNTFRNYGNKYNVKDQLQKSFEGFSDNYLLLSERLRRSTQNSNNSRTPSIKRFVTINEQPLMNFENAQKQQEEISIFDIKKYFKQKYDPTAGSYLGLSQQVQNENQQFENDVQQYINEILIKNSAQIIDKSE